MGEPIEQSSSESGQRDTLPSKSLGLVKSIEEAIRGEEENFVYLTRYNTSVGLVLPTDVKGFLSSNEEYTSLLDDMISKGVCVCKRNEDLLEYIDIDIGHYLLVDNLKDQKQNLRDLSTVRSKMGKSAGLLSDGDNAVIIPPKLNISQVDLLSKLLTTDFEVLFDIGEMV
jgi:hypothetical protein